MLKYFIMTVLVALAAYGTVEAWPLLTGPAIAVTSPQDYGTYGSGIVTISGKASRASELTLDGEPLSRDQDGNFSSTLTFPEGTSILTLVAADRFGKKVAVTRSIFVPGATSSAVN